MPPFLNPTTAWLTCLCHCAWNCGSSLKKRVFHKYISTSYRFVGKRLNLFDVRALLEIIVGSMKQRFSSSFYRPRLEELIVAFRYKLVNRNTALLGFFWFLMRFLDFAISLHFFRLVFTWIYFRLIKWKPKRTSSYKLWPRNRMSCNGVLSYK